MLENVVLRIILIENTLEANKGEFENAGKKNGVDKSSVFANRLLLIWKEVQTKILDSVSNNILKFSPQRFLHKTLPRGIIKRRRYLTNKWEGAIRSLTHWVIQVSFSLPRVIRWTHERTFKQRPSWRFSFVTGNASTGNDIQINLFTFWSMEVLDRVSGIIVNERFAPTSVGLTSH